jgi:hypothetical protein
MTIEFAFLSSILVTAFYGLSLIFTLLNNTEQHLDNETNPMQLERKPLHKLLDVAKKYDFFSMIGAWNFFTPNPITVDFNLLYRDKLDNGEVGPWSGVPPFGHPQMYQALFNPFLRLNGTELDLIRDVVKFAADNKDEKEADFMVLMPQYVALLNIVNSIPAMQANVRQRQFCIVATSGTVKQGKDQVVFQSSFHPIGK